jgi:hypothetical protein
MDHKIENQNFAATSPDIGKIRIVFSRQKNGSPAKPRAGSTNLVV